MKNLLTLAALAGLSATVIACGDDSGDKDTTEQKDAAVKADSSAPPPRAKQIDNLAAKCTADSECKGAGSVTCLTELGGGGGLGGGGDAQPVEVPGGYCTAQCNYSSECGDNGACPLAAVLASPLVAGIAGQFGGAAGLSALFPQQCFEKCTVGDAGGQGSCSRSDHLCRPISALLGATGGGSQLAGLTGLLGDIPELKYNYCFPEIELPVGDAGVGDAGRTTTVTGGLDAGN